MQLNDLSLTPTLAQDPDTDLVWSTQGFVPSNTDPNGGKNFHVYAESNNGAALQCFVGENAVELIGGGGGLTYPGNTQLPAANCLSTLGPNGTITVYVPLSQVSEPGAIDNRLHEVTASTMTLPQPANTVPSVGGIGGSFFDLIDVAQSYVFDPALVQITSITRLANGHALIVGQTAPSLTVPIQFASDLMTTFANFGSATADSTGIFQFDDGGAVGLTLGFYRGTYS
ncbi:MAG TPA: hypothetical protein VEI58_11160 [Chthoniobacterales bacterium]|nr:hypothetical protein [Chthoniobacterales bacterium]